MKTDHSGAVLVMRDLDGPSDSIVHSVNDAPLVLVMVKDTDRAIAWFDGPRNKYDPEWKFNTKTLINKSLVFCEIEIPLALQKVLGM